MWGCLLTFSLKLQLWCWYDTNYLLERLYAYYIPIWVVVFFSIVIYVLVGIKIHRNKVLLRSFQQSLTPNTCSRTFSHHVTYESARDTNTNLYNASVTISAGSNPRRCAVLHSMLSTFRHIFQDNGQMSPSDRTTMAYSRVAFLFFASNVSIWVPASINRVYSVYHPATPSFALNVMAAIVLPLQGLWNCIIYLVVNKATFREIFSKWKARGGVKVRGIDVGQEGTEMAVIGTRVGGGDSSKASIIGAAAVPGQSHSNGDDEKEDIFDALRYCR
jgi:hypothetical protein